MKNSRIVNWMPIGLLCLILLHAVVSWIGDIYGWGLNNLFSQAGIRWTVTYFMFNISCAPFAEVMSALIAIGVLTESGFFAAFSKKASLKQKRALSLSLLVLTIMMVVIACMVLLPNAILLSPFGTLADSPFSQGLLGIICVAIIVVGNVYGLSSGRFFSLTDTIKAHVSLLMPCLPCFLSMMLTAILKESMIYSNVIPMQSTLFTVLSWCLYLFPFAVQLLYLFKSKKKKIIS